MIQTGSIAVLIVSLIPLASSIRVRISQVRIKNVSTLVSVLAMRRRGRSSLPPAGRDHRLRRARRVHHLAPRQRLHPPPERGDGRQRVRPGADPVLVKVCQPLLPDIRGISQVVSVIVSMLADLGILVVVTLTTAMMGPDLTCIQFKYHKVFQTTMRLPFNRFPQDFLQHHLLNLLLYQLSHINHSQPHKI